VPRYWGVHHAIYEGEINRHYQGMEREYKGIPTDANIDIDDVVFLFRGDEYLYGWGKVTNVGKPYSEPSGNIVKDITIDPRVLIQQLTTVEQIKQMPAFRVIVSRKVVEKIRVLSES
jgi:hypothetical protein